LVAKVLFKVARDQKPHSDWLAGTDPDISSQIHNFPTSNWYTAKSKLLYRGRIWVDAADFAVVRIEATPTKNLSFWTKETKIEQEYAKVGGFWLPLFNRSSSAIGLGGHACLTRGSD